MKKMHILLVLLLAICGGCARANPNPGPGPRPTPPGPIVNPNPPRPIPPPVSEIGAVYIPEFGPDTVAVPVSALTAFVPLQDNLKKVHEELKKPLFARRQADGGVALIYNIAGSGQRAYFVFRGGDGLLIRVAQN
jgi:hypothetical protein